MTAESRDAVRAIGSSVAIRCEYAGAYARIAVVNSRVAYLRTDANTRHITAKEDLEPATFSCSQRGLVVHGERHVTCLRVITVHMRIDDTCA